MDGLAFLTLMPLINHRIPHVPLDLYECRFWLKMEGNRTLLAKEQTPTNQTSQHMDQKATREEIQQNKGPNHNY